MHDGSVKRRQRRKWVIWASEASRAGTRERAAKSWGAKERRELSFFSTNPRFCVSSRRLLFMISPKWRACSQAKSEFKNISRDRWFYTRFDFNKVYFCDQPKPVELIEKDWSFAFGLGWNEILPVIADHIIPQDTHQLSPRQPGSSGHLLRNICYTNNYFKPRCRPSKGDPWDNFVRVCNRGRISMDWSRRFNTYAACLCLWKILCRCTSQWKPGNTNVSQSKGVFL